MRAYQAVIFATALLLALVGCNKPQGKNDDGDDKAKEATKKVENEVPVNIAQATLGEISSQLEFDSVLETEIAIDIFPETTGLVVEVRAEVGDAIEAGQVLARLENDDQQINLKESLSRFEHLKTKFERIQDLYDQKLINQQEYDTERFDLEQAEIAYERAKIRLEDTYIRAPVKGLVSKRQTQVGERVGEGRALFTLVNPDELFAEVSIPGQHMLSIRKGLPAEIVSEIIEGISYAASVKLVSPTIDPTSGTCAVKVAIDDNGLMPIYPGMFVSVRLILDTKSNVVLVPKSAIVHEGERAFLYRVENSIARKLRFESGYSNEGFVEAIGGVSQGDSIIVLGHNALKDGAKVKVVNQAYSANKEETGVEEEQAEG